MRPPPPHSMCRQAVTPPTPSRGPRTPRSPSDYLYYVDIISRCSLITEPIPLPDASSEAEEVP